ncbi:MAG: hypothetical protein IJW36_02600 [Clostridia bacterium]|nr:hypothetical protein [Clostridia bacterium]
MFENILKELRIKFNKFKTLIISNSLTNEQAQLHFNELLFASNIVKSSLEKNETAFSTAQLRTIKAFQAEMFDFKSAFPTFFVEDIEQELMIADFKIHLPEKIRTDNLDLHNENLGL